MSLGQRTADSLNEKYADQLESSYLQRKFSKSPGLKMGAMMSKMPIMMAASQLGAGTAAGGLLGAAGLMSAANRAQDTRRVVDYKRAEGRHEAAPGRTNKFDYLRSMSSGINSLANPLAGGAIGAQALSMLGSVAAGDLAGPLLQGSIAARSPIMGSLQMANSSLGLTSALAGAGSEQAIAELGKHAIGGEAFKNISLGSTFLPSTLLYGAGGLVKGAGAAAGMAGLGSTTAGLKAGTGIAGALEAGGGAIGGLGDTLIQALAGMGGASAFAGPLLGMLTSMAVSKPINKVMASFRDKATGNNIGKSMKSFRPRILAASELVKRYSRTRQLDMQAQTLVSIGVLKPFESLVLSYLSSIEKPISLLGFLAESQQSEKARGAKAADQVYEKVGGTLGFKDDDELTRTFNEKFIKGFHNMASKGDKKLSFGDFMESPEEYFKSSMSKVTLGFEKQMLKMGAIFNVPGMILGGKYSIGSKLKDIREKDTQNKMAEAVSNVTGIPTSGVIAMETPVLKLMNQGETTAEKQLAVLSGTYELVRLSTFFLQDIRTALGVTKKNSMLGKMKEVTEESKKLEDNRSTGYKIAMGAADFVDKIPGLSILGSLAGMGLREHAELKNTIKESGSMAGNAAKKIFKWKSSGTADDTELALEKDQADEDEITRKKSLLQSVVNIEKSLEKCCGKGKHTKFGNTLFGDKKKKVGVSGISSIDVAKIGIGNAIVAGIMSAFSKLSFLTLMGAGAAIYSAENDTLKNILTGPLSTLNASLLSGAIEGAMMGRLLGIGPKGMAIGALAGVVMKGTSHLVDELIDPQGENKKWNTTIKNFSHILEGAGVGFLVAGVPGAIAGALAVMAYKAGAYLFESGDKYDERLAQGTRVHQVQVGGDPELKKLENAKNEAQKRGDFKEVRRIAKEMGKRQLVVQQTSKTTTTAAKVKDPMENKIIPTEGTNTTSVSQQVSKTATVKEDNPIINRVIPIGGPTTTTSNVIDKKKVPEIVGQFKDVSGKIFNIEKGITQTPVSQQVSKTTAIAVKVKDPIINRVIPIGGPTTTTSNVIDKKKVPEIVGQFKDVSGKIFNIEKGITQTPKVKEKDTVANITNKTKVDISKKETQEEERIRLDREITEMNSANVVDAIFGMRQESAMIGKVMVDTMNTLVGVSENGNGILEQGVRAQVSTAHSSAATAKKTDLGKNAIAQQN